MKNLCWKGKQMVMFILLCVWLTQFHTAFANTEFDKLNPNEYKQKEFESNTELINNDSLLQSKEKISEAQKLLTFIPDYYPQTDLLMEQLFTEGVKERKTVRIVSQQLNLFSEESNDILFETQGQSIKKEANHSGLKTVYIGFIVGLLLIVLLLILPRTFKGRDTTTGRN